MHMHRLAGRFAVMTLGMLLVGSMASAQGYMSFTSTATTVTTGDPASYMRAGIDWDKSTLVGGIASPTISAPAKITTSRDATNLVFHFVIPDNTPKKPDGSALTCGDRVILQIDPANSKAADLSSGNYFRYELSINSLVMAPVVLRKPLAFGAFWKWNTVVAATTATTSSFTFGTEYTFDFTVPLAELGTVAPNFGITMALINDLGHSHGSGINEMTGTTFPLSMGLVPESDPQGSCGPNPPPTENASGNWVKPNTWGIGYAALASVPPTVSFDPMPQYTLSKSLKIGDCRVTNWTDMVSIPSATNWEAIQAGDPHWYLYNPVKPCRMGIWINALVSGAGIGQKQFLILWATPNTGGADWHFVGVTNPVALAAPSTVINFLWDKPDPGAFTFGHPCLRVYVLPAGLTAAQVATLALIKNSTDVTAMESTYSVSATPTYSAQMNFANLGTGSCPAGVCFPLASNMTTMPAKWLSLGLVRDAYAATVQPKSTQGSDKQPPGEGSDGTAREKRIRLIAHAFGVAEPSPRNYAFVEAIGSLGWSIPVSFFSNAPYTLQFDVGNPKVAEKMFVGGTPVEVAAPPRRMYIATTMDLPAGVKAPALDTAAINRIGDTPIAPGTVVKAQIGLLPTGGGGLAWWVWLLVLIAIVLLFLLFRRLRTP